MELTRGPLEPLGMKKVAGSAQFGGDGNDFLTQEDPSNGLPGAIAFWEFSGTADATFHDERGEHWAFRAFSLNGNRTASQRRDGATEGPDGRPDTALYFDGVNDFAYSNHHKDYQFTQGTVALWVRPDDLTDISTIVSKDQSGNGNGGHFEIGHTDNGGLFLRTAPGNGSSNKAWETGPGFLDEGEWQHLAVSVTEDGVFFYVDGNLVPAGAWRKVEGDVNSPNEFTGAYFLNNEEPWVLGTDGQAHKSNDGVQDFASDNAKLRNPFEGAIAEFGIWGGYTKDDALTRAEINNLKNNGPGTALSNPNGLSPHLAANDHLVGGGGNDTIEGLAGDDRLFGQDGADRINGGYGNDFILGGTGNDILDGGWGNDYIHAGSGNDIIYSRSDVGEDRAGQLVLGTPTRSANDPHIHPKYLKLVDWIDQPFAGDDVFFGGAGRDQFVFELGINAKLDILDSRTRLMDDDRTIKWNSVAGTNGSIHEHWIDGIGIDIIGDFNAAQDSISVKGHTTDITVAHKGVDTDGDGVEDEAVSIITAYSQQQSGAHAQDLLGYIVVYGDRVEYEDVEIDPSVHYGVVETIDDAIEAVAPSGEAKTYSDPRLFGYDSRDVAGDPIGSDPEAYSSNPWLESGEVSLGTGYLNGVRAPNIVLYNIGRNFDGVNQSREIAHASNQEVREGTWSFLFRADNPSNGDFQAIVSKDHGGFKDGGHMTAFLRENGVLRVRFQDENGNAYLLDSDDPIEAGQEYHVGITFSTSGMALFLDGALQDSDRGLPGGMNGNAEDLVLGASTMQREGDNDKLNDFFDGRVKEVALLDRELDPSEVVILAANDGDLSIYSTAYNATSSRAVASVSISGETAQSNVEEPAPANSGDTSGDDGVSSIFASAMALNEANLVSSDVDFFL